MAAVRALDPATVRLLGSSLSIVSPAALVKELVENAIDAQATSIEVHIAPNTVDKIQVKDNGRGISIDDYEMLGRRAHTSKLRQFNELQGSNFQTLGFRGEALASANCIGTLTITTRTAEDPIATRLKLTPKVGGVETRNPASANVGTTVKVERLFEMVPVRKQQALKEARKCIARIQNLLQAYAMARPHLKLSIKVLMEPKHNWDYTPSLTPSTRDAAMQIFGKGLVATCELAQAEAHDDHTESACIVEALLPRKDCDPRFVNGKGAFVSVDSRPLSSLDGFGKRLASIFNSQFKASAESESPSRKLSAPFVQVNIRCPVTVYDFNISPLKDDILFVDEHKILNLVTTMIQSFYETPTPEKNVPDTPQNPPGSEGLIENQEQSYAAGLPFQTLRPHEADEVRSDVPEYAEMRTSAKVNLARTISSETDEDSMLETIKIRIPSEPLVHGNCSAESSGPENSTTKPLQSQTAQDIHRYFKPTKKSFDIATDETATEECSPDTLALPASSDTTKSGGRRQPLRPLTDSVINTVNTEVDEGLRAPNYEPVDPLSLHPVISMSRSPETIVLAARVESSPSLSSSARGFYSMASRFSQAHGCE